jgi:hypothetical protein
MAPSFILCAIFTVALVGSATLLGAWREDLVIRMSIRAAVAFLWLFQLGRWGHRLIATNYRLTTQRLICGRKLGLRSPPDRGILLENIAQVLVERTPLERALKIGRLRVIIADEKRSSAILDGVHDPVHTAIMIRRQVKRARYPVTKTD